eukprot:CAMPEP_0194109464 /NCGR_PEP_ID=MMETSP0150-20130528/8944_1 /TAXON_ID=122233 /ORGANISM="Chaetoceros debilis, Strain MM31A-1" /LENGTH=437 /DNA_ID=CAMNT_0038798421 /DNA_START=82 /DNA_END=1395 /DNA_ORIENTATION=-
MKLIGLSSIFVLVASGLVAASQDVEASPTSRQLLLSVSSNESKNKRELLSRFRNTKHFRHLEEAYYPSLGSGIASYVMATDFATTMVEPLMENPDISKCFDFPSLLIAAASSDGEKIFEPQCSAKDKKSLWDQFEKFDTCTGWDSYKLLEEMPSILLGTIQKCLFILSTDIPPGGFDKFSKFGKYMDMCTDGFFGDNPFAVVLRDMFVHSDAICSCMDHLDSLEMPKCYLDEWPMLISGTTIKTSSCLLAQLCPYIDESCEDELKKLETCFDSRDSCEETALNCDDMTMFLPEVGQYQIMPMTDACRRVYNTNNPNGSLMKDFDKHYEKCKSKSFVDAWANTPAFSGVGSGPSSSIGSSSGSTSTSLTASATFNSKKDEEWEGGKKSEKDNGFFGGILMFAAGAASAVLISRKIESRHRRGSGKYAAAVGTMEVELA